MIKNCTKYFSIISFQWIFIICPVRPAHILGVFPISAKSHFGFHEAIMRSLLTAGHNVTIIAPFIPQNLHPNLTLINSTAETSNVNPFKSFIRTGMSHLSLGIKMIEVFEKDCYQILDSIDIMYVEMLPMCHCYSFIQKRLKIPVIGTIAARSSLNADDSIGNLLTVSVSFTEFSLTSTNQTFYDRLLGFAEAIKTRVFSLSEKRKLNIFQDKKIPNQRNRHLKLSLLFVNNHMSILPKTTVPNTVSIGGIHVKSAKLSSLPKTFQEFIEEAEHGVILFSLGSVVSNDVLDPRFIITLNNAFAKIPQRVVWKINTKVENLPFNVLPVEWMPQKEILAHDNVLAFISHCGLSSVYEAIYFSKPVISIPIFGDQFSNAGLLRSLGVGIYLDGSKLTEIKLLNAIDEIINNTSYRKNMETLSRRFKDDPQSPEKQVIYWTKYVLQHKGAFHLRVTSADLALPKYLLLDVFIFGVILAILTRLLLHLVMKMLFLTFCPKVFVKKVDSKKRK